MTLGSQIVVWSRLSARVALILALVASCLPSGRSVFYEGTQTSAGFPRVENVAADAYDVVLKTSTSGTAYYILLPMEAEAPSAMDVIQGFSFESDAVTCGRVEVQSDVVARVSVQVPSTCSEAQSSTFYGLQSAPTCRLCPIVQASTDYILYAVLVSDETTVSDTLRKVPFLSADDLGQGAAVAPLFTQIEAVDVGMTGATFQLALDSAGQIRYRVQLRDTPEPTIDAFDSSTDNLVQKGVLTVTNANAISALINGLASETAYDVYFLAYSAAYVQAYLTKIQVTTDGNELLTVTLAATGTYGDSNKVKDSPIMIEATFSSAIASFDAAKVVIQGGDIYQDPDQCASYVRGSGAGPYTFGVVPDASIAEPASIQVSLLAGAGTEASLDQPSEASSALSLAFKETKPTITMTVVTDNFPYSLSIYAEFSEIVTGFDLADLSFAGCTLDYRSVSLSASSGKTAFQATFNVLNNREDVTIYMLENKAVDGYGNGNAASNVVHYANPGYHATGLTFVDSDNRETFVGWGETMCFTPDDERVRSLILNNQVIQQRYARLLFTETNLGVGVVAQGRRNYLKYDDVMLTSSSIFQWDEIQINGTNDIMIDLEIGDLGGPSADGNEHTLSLVLDSTNLNIESGTINLRYCGFGTEESPQCDCKPDIGGGEGVSFGDRSLAWGTSGNCINPEDITTFQGVTGLNVLFTEAEIANLHGYHAEQAGYSVGAPSFRSVVYVDGAAEHMSKQKTLLPDASASESFFLAIDVTDLDKANHTLKLVVDHDNAIAEADEANEFSLEYRYCWPPNFKFDTTCLGVGHAQQQGSRRLLDRASVNRCMAMDVESPQCIYPSDLEVKSDYEHAYVNVSYAVVFDGLTDNSFENCGFETTVSLDGALVETVAQEPLDATRWSDPLTLSLGRPDFAVHEVVLNISSGVRLGAAEASLDDNVAVVKVEFCDFFNDLTAGEGLYLGKDEKFVRWGDIVCLSDEDFVAQSLPLKYSEMNVGDGSVPAGYVNALHLDSASIHQDLMRPSLDKDGERNVSVVGGLNIDDAWMDAADHTLSLKLDVTGALLYELNASNTFDLTLKFCLVSLGPSRCGCRSDISAGQLVHIGNQTGSWGQSDPMCLEPTDMNDDGTFSLAFYEANVGTYALKPTQNGHVNRLFFNDQIVSTTEIRPPLDVLEQRGPMYWGEDVSFGMPNKVVNTLTLEVDYTDVVNEFDAVQGLANEFSIPIRFCNFMPDLTLGEGIQLGTEYVRWGEEACLSSNDLIVVPLVGSGVENGIDIKYTEQNLGMVASEEGWNVVVCWNNELAFSLDARPALEASAKRDITVAYAYGSFTSLKVTPRAGRNIVTLVIDGDASSCSGAPTGGSALDEVDEGNNRRSAYIFFEEQNEKAVK